MKLTRKKISVTMSSWVFAEVGRERDANVSRSAFIERVLRDHFKREREAINRRDLDSINANVDHLIPQAKDPDQYQAPIDFSSDEE